MPYILDLLKGVAVTLACLVLASLHLSELFSGSVTDLYVLMGLALFAMPVGAGLAGIAIWLRTDRILSLLAVVLGLAAMISLGSGSFGSELDIHPMFGAYLWIVLGTVALALWTEPRSPFPHAHVPGFRLPRWRRPTAIELSTLMWLALAFVTALDSYDGGSFEHAFLMLVAIAVPMGVGIGAVAECLSCLRLPLLGLVVTVAASYAAVYAGLATHIEPSLWHALAILATLIAIERFSRQPGNATTCEAGSTNTTP